MKLGILSDAHGNTGALDAAVEALGAAGAERFFFLGDAVGYIPDPGVVTRLRMLDIPSLKGNHEEMMLDSTRADGREQIYRHAETRAALSFDDVAYLQNAAESRRLVLDGVDCLFVHGSPLDPAWGYVYPDTDLAVFDHVGADAVFMGHTHRPFVRRQGDTLFVNVGSCGMPRDADRQGAACLFDTASGEATILRFDIAAECRLALKSYELHETVAAALKRLAGEDVHV